MSDPGANTTGFPQIATPFVDEQRNITQPWYRLLLNLFLKSGGSLPPTSATYLQAIGGGNFAVIDATTGDNLGTVVTVAPSRGASQPQIVGASPYVFTAAGVGSLVVESGQVEVSNDAGATYLIAGLAGGVVPCLTGTRVRVTYYNSKPSVTFLPTSGF